MKPTSIRPGMRRNRTQTDLQANDNQPNDAAHGPRPSFTITSDTYAHELYNNTVKLQDVDTFLQEDDYYDTTQKRWSFTPVLGTTELVGAVYNVLRSIVGLFVKSEEPGVEREVLNTLEIPTCESTNKDGYRACPVLLVRASGPSFQIPEALIPLSPISSSLGFSNMATYFSVKLEADIGTEEEILEEMASYSRQIFREQPNRFFVRSLVITERHVRLVHFDRAGSQISPPIDVHHHPVTLIRLVIGLSSASERLLGLDESVQWTVIDGRKSKGTLTTIGPSGERKNYRILEQIPTSRDSIRGRATTCWRVQDPDTSEEYVVKDSWRPDDRTAEHEFLELVKNIPGVVQMISYETGNGETMDFRCPSTTGQYHNRISARVTMHSYGKPLMFFTSVLQLLFAVRDAIAAHRRLVRDDIGTLHRDVSHNNILFGKEGAPEGERGVIIDFDMAFRGTEAKPTVRAEHNIGTRLFQSLSVVGSSYLEDEVPAYDYLDDLESFLYLLTYIFLLYKPDGSRLSSTEQGPSIVWGWGEEDPETAYSSKCKLYGAGAVAGRALRLVERNWGSTCGALFDGFSWWVLDRRGEKSDLLVGPEATGGPNPLETLHSRREDHYAEVLKMFDEAIGALKESTPQNSTAPPVNHVGEAAHGVSPVGPPTAPPVSIATSPFPVSITTAPLLDVEMAPPAALPTPSGLPVTPKPRRSARIWNLRHTKSEGQPPSSARTSAPAKAPHPVTPEVRRSDRIRKRRLEDDELSGMPPPQPKRIKRARRVAVRSR